TETLRFHRATERVAKSKIAGGAMPKSTRNIGMSELRVGLLGFIALAVLILLVLNASGGLTPFKSHLHLRARFVGANGLREGSDGKLAGGKMGIVDGILSL